MGCAHSWGQLEKYPIFWSTHLCKIHLTHLYFIFILDWLSSKTEAKLGTMLFSVPSNKINFSMCEIFPISGQCFWLFQQFLHFTILILSAYLSGWGRADKRGCPDKSDIVKDMNTDTPEDPCGGGYTLRWPPKSRGKMIYQLVINVKSLNQIVKVFLETELLRTTSVSLKIMVFFHPSSPILIAD